MPYSISATTALSLINNKVAHKNKTPRWNIRYWKCTYNILDENNKLFEFHSFLFLFITWLYGQRTSSFRGKFLTHNIGRMNENEKNIIILMMMLKRKRRNTFDSREEKYSFRSRTYALGTLRNIATVYYKAM